MNIRILPLTSQFVPNMATIAPEIADAMDRSVSDAKTLLREVDLDVNSPNHRCLCPAKGCKHKLVLADSGLDILDISSSGTQL